MKIALASKPTKIDIKLSEIQLYPTIMSKFDKAKIPTRHKYCFCFFIILENLWTHFVCHFLFVIMVISYDINVEPLQPPYVGALV